MLLTLATHYSKLSAFLMLEIFLFAGVNSASAFVKYSPRETLPLRYVSVGRSLNAVGSVPESIKMVNVSNQASVLKENKFINAGTGNLSYSGPGQPEMSAFKSVGSDNMVDPFSGDFSYNIPLMDVGGYPVNIFYNSGITMDQEASWVGLGWNINPGTIMRNMRGLPDDFDGSKGDVISKTQFTKAEKTWGVSVGGSMEIFGGPIKLNLSAGIFYNNMRGVGLEAGLNPTLAIGSTNGDEKTAPLNFGWALKANSQTGGSQTFKISLNNKEKESGATTAYSASLGYHSRAGLQSLHLSAEYSKDIISSKGQKVSAANGDFGINPTMGTTISFAYPAITPSIRSRTRSRNINLDLGFGSATWGGFSNLRLGGYYTTTYLRNEDITVQQPAYGMLYMQQGNNDKNALLDFNRLNDGLYTPNAPTIAIPAYTYDVFSINGEGTGGSFRAYRGDIGFVNDPYTESSSESDALGFEVGGGTYGHGAINLNMVHTPSYASAWEGGNFAKKIMSFKNSAADYQSSYFKNPGEKAIPDIDYQNAIGDDDLVRLKMSNTGNGGNPQLQPVLMKYTDTRQYKTGQDRFLNDANTLKKRDKRTQVISFLTAEEAEKVALNKKIPTIKPIYYYDSLVTVSGCSPDKVDSIKRADAISGSGYRKPHHISEINVLTQEGKRYVYGTPVYNTKQTDVTFNKTGNPTTQLSSYVAGTDDQPNIPGQGFTGNSNGKDGYVEKQSMPPYTHSFLLNGLLSPNYVDVKGDGITDDDMGDAVKFNYSKMELPLGWRTPVGPNSATFNEGLKTDKNDDKSHYIYGEREMWYLYNIESKNMVARFYIKNDRMDSRSVNETGSLNPGWGAQRLSKISLFSKADLLKYGSAAKPIKTVHFSYDYSLCPGAAGSVSGYGKLTLKSIHFTYNGNNKLKKNYYRFSYPADNNPTYNYTELDRWGNYKSPAGNQGGLKNSDYPYVNTNKTISDKHAAAWTLNKIGLPSGAEIKVQYEADDYAFVQDRRASNMFAIKGFGDTRVPSASMLTSNKLYRDKNYDYQYIYITVPKAITGSESDAKRQIENLYLANLSKTRQLFMKLAVQILPGQPSTELIPIYAEIDGNDYGAVPNSGGFDIYIKVKKVASDYTPMVQHSLQFMKNYLPGKAYPGNDVSDETALRAVVKALGGLYHSFKESFSQGFALFKKENKCRYTDNSQSFIRLTDPYLQKAGGGLRVKKIEINDNFDKMTRSQPGVNDGMINATYGQEYFYTKQEMVGNQMQTISSGVAAWEPSIGGEENPHREIMSYFNKNKKGPFDFGAVEMPIAEMFYPSSSVGYSRVEVRSIHRDTVKNAPGIQVTEFFTTREFPTKVSFTNLTDPGATDKFEPSPLLRFLKIDVNKAVSLSQGFKVDLNDMNGKMQKQSNFAPNNLISPISYSENFYNTTPVGNNIHKFNHSFPVIQNSSGIITPNVTIGREVELMTDFREHKMETFTTNLNFNLDIIAGLFIPIPVPTWFSPTVYESDTYRSASVLKVVNHYGMLDSIVVVDKGSMVSSKNLIYDAESGEPLVTRTNNEHNRPLYNFTYPAHWGYSGMSPAYKNIDVTYRGITFKQGRIVGGNVNMNLFESGDEIYVRAENNTGPNGVLPCDPNTNPLPKNNSSKIWAINTAKTGSPTPEMVFIDADGNPYSAKDVYLHIIRSGKRNMAGVSLGNITSLNSPVSGNTITLNDATNILQATGAAFKDHWRVDDVLYKKDSVITIVTQASIAHTRVYGQTLFSAELKRHTESGNVDEYTPLPNLGFAIRKDRRKPGAGNASKRNYDLNSWLRFNLPASLNGVIVQSATVNLTAHNNNHYINHNSNLDRMLGRHSTGQPHHHGKEENNVNDPTQLIFRVSRMKTTWPTNAADWLPVFHDNSNFIDNSSTSPPSPPPPIQIGSFSRSYNIPAKNLAQSMVNNINNPNNAQGIKLSYEKTSYQINAAHSSEGWRYCFDFGTQGTGANMDIYYYYCVPSNPIVYQGAKSDAPQNTQPGPGTPPTTVYCYNDQTFSFCRSKFSKKSINPYVEGVWGNWRVDTTFSYYSNRKESDAANNEIDLRTAGAILNFKSFWNFNSTKLQRHYAAADVWPWTSAITQYNRKGYDIENKDPLGRYNAGLYGYNQQLPVAVINNSHYAESMFDGFEDYTYQSNSCAEYCVTKKHVNFGTAAQFIDNTQKHTGKHSLRVNAGTSVKITAPVVSAEILERGYRMRVRVDSIAQSSYTSVIPTGSGLKATYTNHPVGSAKPLEPGTGSNNYVTPTPDAVSFNLGPNSPVPGIINTNVWSVKYEGNLQPTVTGFYQFFLNGQGRARLKINGAVITPAEYWNWGGFFMFSNPLFTTGSSNIYLTAGAVYPIEISYYDYAGPSSLNFSWKRSGFLANVIPVPASMLYLPGQATGTVQTGGTWCSKLDSIQVRDNSLTDSFTLIKNKKMLLSAWVKEGGVDCKTCEYTKNSVGISYNNGSISSGPDLKPQGPVIEGWQRYEGEFVVPENAINVKVEFKNSSIYPVWYDDVRIHPFNANMKSFVYHNSNLKLMSELDENNYASFYEYDDDGTLARVKKETVRGIKTISETRSALQKSVTE